MLNPDKYFDPDWIDEKDVGKKLIQGELENAESEDEVNGETVVMLKNGQKFRVRVEEEEN